MRIPDYRNVHGVKGSNQRETKISKVDKTHKDEFEKELENSIHKRKPKAKAKKKEETQKEQLALIYENQEINEMQLEIDQFFSGYDKKIKSETDIEEDKKLK